MSQRTLPYNTLGEVASYYKLSCALWHISLLLQMKWSHTCRCSMVKRRLIERRIAPEICSPWRNMIIRSISPQWLAVCVSVSDASSWRLACLLGLGLISSGLVMARRVMETIHHFAGQIISLGHTLAGACQTGSLGDGRTTWISNAPTWSARINQEMIRDATNTMEAIYIV